MKPVPAGSRFKLIAHDSRDDFEKEPPEPPEDGDWQLWDWRIEQPHHDGDGGWNQGWVWLLWVELPKQERPNDPPPRTDGPVPRP